MIRRLIVLWMALFLAILTASTADAAAKRSGRPKLSAQQRRAEMIRQREAASRAYYERAKRLEKDAARAREFLAKGGQHKEPAKPGLELAAKAVMHDGSAKMEFMPLWTYPVGAVVLLVMGIALGRRTPTLYTDSLQGTAEVDEFLEIIPDGQTLGLRSWDIQEQKVGIAPATASPQPVSRDARPATLPEKAPEYDISKMKVPGLQLVMIGDDTGTDYLNVFASEPAAPDADAEPVPAPQAQPNPSFRLVH